jgi:hypothetical protein
MEDFRRNVIGRYYLRDLSVHYRVILNDNLITEERWCGLHSAGSGCNPVAVT